MPPRPSSWNRREVLGTAGRLAAGAAAWTVAGAPLGAQPTNRRAGVVRSRLVTTDSQRVSAFVP